MKKPGKTAAWLISAVVVASAAAAIAFGTSPNENDPLLTPAGSSARTVNASAIGYAGPVLVRMTLNAEGKIESLDIGGARFAETEGIGSRVREASFATQFIGKKPPLIPGKDADVIAGATLSSEAVIQAINDGAAFLAQQ